MTNKSDDIIKGQVYKRKAFFKWVINDFSPAVMQYDKQIFSPIFSTCINGLESKWQLKLCLGDRLDELRDVAIYAIRRSNVIVTAVITFGVLKNDKEVPTLRNTTKKRAFTKQTNDWGFNKFMPQSLLTNMSRGVLINGQLTVTIEILPEESDFHSANTKFSESSSIRLVKDYENLINREKFSDVVFEFGRTKLYAHKNILSARSTYFAAMFEHDMLGKTGNVVEITDFSYEIFEEMFKFLYTGRVDKIDKMADDLLIASNKYGLDELKALCENFIIYSLTKTNVLKYFTLAGAHNGANLKATTLEFIQEHGRDIIDTAEYKLYEELHPREVCEIFRNLFHKKPRVE